MTNLEMFFNALCNQCLVYSDVYIDFKKKDVPDDMEFSTREDKWLWLIENGKGIYLIDDGESMERVHITLDLINKRFEELRNDASFLHTIAEYYNESDDSVTADNLIQLIAYGEIVFG